MPIFMGYVDWIFLANLSVFLWEIFCRSLVRVLGSGNWWIFIWFIGHLVGALWLLGR